MTEEIKEIIDDLGNKDSYVNDITMLTFDEGKMIKDYITNLQQLYENGLKVNQNSHKYITELEMNNAILKEELKNRRIVDFTFDVYKELEDYKSRCEKAIEYIKEHIKYECDDNFNGMSFYSYHLYDFKKEDLLNILNGSDENE